MFRPKRNRREKSGLSHWWERPAVAKPLFLHSLDSPQWHLHFTLLLPWWAKSQAWPILPPLTQQSVAMLSKGHSLGAPHAACALDSGHPHLPPLPCNYLVALDGMRQVPSGTQTFSKQSAAGAWAVGIPGRPITTGCPSWSSSTRTSTSKRKNAKQHAGTGMALLRFVLPTPGAENRCTLHPLPYHTAQAKTCHVLLPAQASPRANKSILGLGER